MGDKKEIVPPLPLTRVTCSDTGALFMHPATDTQQTKIGQNLTIRNSRAIIIVHSDAECPHIDGLLLNHRSCGVWRQVFPSRADTVDDLLLDEQTCVFLPHDTYKWPCRMLRG